MSTEVHCILYIVLIIYQNVLFFKKKKINKLTSRFLKHLMKLKEFNHKMMKISIRGQNSIFRYLTWWDTLINAWQSNILLRTQNLKNLSHINLPDLTKDKKLLAKDLSVNIVNADNSHWRKRKLLTDSPIRVIQREIYLTVSLNSANEIPFTWGGGWNLRGRYLKTKIPTEVRKYFCNESAETLGEQTKDTNKTNTKK